ncbi:hypothetical protein AVEN_237538-1 [Araneus ventricosus]|uniref:Uncharacterized protein n=1 Tax=Araneus ventricosus TaxID=182803 RepID=A0A4Y2NDN6_ARAVE|nr:hypothetical protein AVEN_237538-1 [Araneus ventricosus]
MMMEYRFSMRRGRISIRFCVARRKRNSGWCGTEFGGRCQQVAVLVAEQFRISSSYQNNPRVTSKGALSYSSTSENILLLLILYIFSSIGGRDLCKGLTAFYLGQEGSLKPDPLKDPPCMWAHRTQIIVWATSSRSAGVKVWRGCTFRCHLFI